jgi:cation transport regulator ChaB
VPKTTKSGKPKQDELPSTLRRSPQKAQRTFAKTYDSATETYDGDESRAARTAYAAVKHSFEKVGDHWEPKDEKGPSDAQSAKGGRAARDSSTPTAGGVDANASKKHLYEIAQRLDVPGRSTMDKDELVEAIGKANDRATARARRD